MALQWVGHGAPSYRSTVFCETPGPVGTHRYLARRQPVLPGQESARESSLEQELAHPRTSLGSLRRLSQTARTARVQSIFDGTGAAGWSFRSGDKPRTVRLVGTPGESTAK